MSTRTALRWLLTGVAFLLMTAAAFVPALFLLTSTPLHGGDVLPGPLLLSATLLLSSALDTVRSPPCAPPGARHRER